MPRTGLVIGPTAATPPGLHSNHDRFRSQAMTIPAVPIDPPLTGDSAGPPKRAPSAIRNMVVSLLGDVGLPVAAYFIAELLGASTYRSLLAGTVVAGLRMGWVAIRERRFDVFATFLLVLFGAGFVLTFVTGDVRFVLAKDATTSATAGLIFLGSCIVNRPLAYYAAKPSPAPPAAGSSTPLQTRQSCANGGTGSRWCGGWVCSSTLLCASRASIYYPQTSRPACPRRSWSPRTRC